MKVFRGWQHLRKSFPPEQVQQSRQEADLHKLPASSDASLEGRPDMQSCARCPFRAYRLGSHVIRCITSFNVS